MQMNANDARVVMHIMNIWLSRTQTWLYGEVTNLDSGWESWVVANRTANLDEFPYENLYSLRDSRGRLRWFVELAMRRVGLVRQLPALNRFVKAKRPAVLHSHFGTTGWRNLPAARSINARHVVSFYGFDVTSVPRRSKWRRRYRELFANVDRVLCEGPHMGKQIETLGCPAEKIRIYPLGVDLKKLVFVRRTRAAGQPLRILMAATFNEKKGLPYALDAIGELRKGRPDMELEITVVGGPGKSRESRNTADAIRTSVSRYDLDQYIEFVGFQDHAALLEIAARHDIFLSPSVTATNGDTEGGAPVVIIEMAALGMPIVSTTHCDIPNVLGERNKALLVAERDTAGLVRALEWLIDNADQWPDIGRNNRAHIEQNFDLERQARALSDIYAEITEVSFDSL